MGLVKSAALPGEPQRAAQSQLGAVSLEDHASNKLLFRIFQFRCPTYGQLDPLAPFRLTDQQLHCLRAPSSITIKLYCSFPHS